MADSHFRTDANGVSYQYAVDSTSLKAMQTCPRYYQYSIIESWEPARKSRHLTFGGHYATALERFYKCQAQGMSIDDSLDIVLDGVLKDSWEYERNAADEILVDAEGKRKGAPWDSMDNAKNRETLVRSIIWYIDHFKGDNLKTLILDNGKPAVELSFTLELNADETWPTERTAATSVPSSASTTKSQRMGR